MDKQIVILNMKSRFLLSVVFFGMIAGLSASPVYRMGSYNIRGENAADTGDKDWNVRKEYVVRNIVEHDFDVVGLQENSIKMLPQLEELLGDDYATHSWGPRRAVRIRQSYTRPGSLLCWIRVDIS